MFDAFFDEWGRIFENDWTKHHKTRQCNMEAQTRYMSLRQWLEKLCRFCFQTWHFCEEGVYNVYDKKDGTPFMVVSPDGSLRRSADGLVDIHTNPPLSLEIKCRFSFTQGIPVYSEVPIRHIPQCTLYRADGPSKRRPLTSLLVSEKW